MRGHAPYASVIHLMSRSPRRHLGGPGSSEKLRLVVGDGRGTMLRIDHMSLLFFHSSIFAIIDKFSGCAADAMEAVWRAQSRRPA